jgi:hypothetical protein
VRKSGQKRLAGRKFILRTKARNENASRLFDRRRRLVGEDNNHDEHVENK